MLLWLGFGPNMPSFPLWTVSHCQRDVYIAHILKLAASHPRFHFMFWHWHPHVWSPDSNYGFRWVHLLRTSAVPACENHCMSPNTVRYHNALNKLTNSLKALCTATGQKCSWVLNTSVPLWQCYASMLQIEQWCPKLLCRCEYMIF